MYHFNHTRNAYKKTLTTGLIIAITTFFGEGVSFGHGGKTHADQPFSAFEAIQKASELYDQLIVSGKLGEGWETALSTIDVSVRGEGESRETGVRFKRSSGDPGPKPESIEIG